jgi:Uma2 family endonuclease
VARLCAPEIVWRWYPKDVAQMHETGAKPMATVPRTRVPREVDYPTSDGKPMGETDLHRQDMMDVITTLQRHFAADPNVYVSGNLLLFYEEGNRRKHISPDAFVVKGVPKAPPRDYYLLWKEGRGPDVVLEITSKTTRREDQQKKWVLYRDVLKVPEYFQFDPREEYLKPSLQGHRLANGEYLPIAMVGGRMPSEVLGLHLEREGQELRLFDPETGRRLRTAAEDADAARAQSIEERRRAEEEHRRAEEERRRAEEERRRAEEAIQTASRAEERALRAEMEMAQLRAQVERLLRDAEGRRDDS